MRSIGDAADALDALEPDAVDSFGGAMRPSVPMRQTDAMEPISRRLSEPLAFNSSTAPSASLRNALALTMRVIVLF